MGNNKSFFFFFFTHCQNLSQGQQGPIGFVSLALKGQIQAFATLGYFSPSTPAQHRSSLGPQLPLASYGDRVQTHGPHVLYAPSREEAQPFLRHQSTQSVSLLANASHVESRLFPSQLDLQPDSTFPHSQSTLIGGSGIFPVGPHGPRRPQGPACVNAAANITHHRTNNPLIRITMFIRC